MRVEGVSGRAAQLGTQMPPTAAAVAWGTHNAGEIDGQTRQHAGLIHLLGVEQIAIGMNETDCGLAGDKKDRHH